MHILMCTRCARRPHTKKLLSTTLHTPYLTEILNIFVPIDPSHLCASFTAAVPSTIITYDQLLQNRKYLQYGLSNGKHR